MNEADSRKWTSNQQIGDVLTKNRPVYSSDPVTTKLADQFFTLFAEIAPWRVKMDQPTTWLTREKNDTKFQLTGELRTLTLAATRFAIEEDDTQLLNVSRKTKSELMNMPQADLLIFGYDMLKVVQDNAEAFVAYGISAEFIANYSSILDAFEKKMGACRLLASEKKKGGVEFRKRLKDISLFLEDKLDWSIDSYEKTAPAMVDDYFAARKLPKLITRHIDVRGFVVDALSEKPLSFGLVTVVETKQTTNITSRGNFNFKNFPEGESTLLIENLGYETLVVPVRRHATEHIVLEIKMQAVPLMEPHSVK